MDPNRAVFKIDEQKFAVPAHCIDGLTNGRTRGWRATANEGVGADFRDDCTNGWEQDRAIRLYFKQFWHDSTLTVT